MAVKHGKTLTCLALALAPFSSFSHAQLLEEVVVTAQKRAQSLQDVPISVSALQGDKLKDAGIPNMAAVADYVPNLHIANAAVNTNIYMRGVGSGNNQGFEQSVGMYIDGVYMGRGRQYRNAFVDLERVEVLRGPQGTLFGRNTVAGAINITTASPDAGQDWEGEFAIALEENGGQTYEGFVGGSFSENTGIRVGFKHRETDGYVDNLLLGANSPATEDTSFRITFAWQAMDNLDFSFKYSKSDEERTGSPSGTWKFLSPAERVSQLPNITALAAGAYALTDANFPEFANIANKDFTVFKDNGFGGGATNSEPGLGRYGDGDDATVENWALNTNYQMGEYTLTSVTGWSEYEVQSGADVDFLPLSFIARDDDQNFEQFSQEFRIASPSGERFEFVAGAYYDKSKLVTDRLVEIDLSLGNLIADFPGNLLNPALPPVPLGLIGITNLSPFVNGGSTYRPDIIGRNHRYALDSDSWALFFQGTYNISDSFRVTLGLRYTEENKDVDSVQFLTDGVSGDRTPNDTFALGFIQATTFNTYAYDYKRSRTTSDLIPSVNFQWDLSDNSMLYFSFSQGFKSGGFTASDDGEPGEVDAGTWTCTENPDGSVDIDACYDPNLPNEDFEFDDESVDAFEIGGKHTLLGGAMTVNWAAFYTEYDNLQTSIFKGVGFTTTNAGSSEIKGIEVDALWQTTENLRLGANVAWLDATYSEFANAPCTALQIDTNPQCGVSGPTNVQRTFNDLSGEPTLYASDYSASLLFDYNHPIGSVDLFLGGEVNYRDEFQSAGDNDSIDLIPSYTKVNLRIGVRAEQWEVMAFGRNLFDEIVYSQSADTPLLTGSHFRFQEEGAVFGVRGKFSF